MFFLCSVYVLVYVLFVFFVSIICVRPYFYVFLCFFVQANIKNTKKHKAIRKSSTKNKSNINKKTKHKQNTKKKKQHKQVYATFVFCLCFVCVLFVFRLCFFMYVKILRSYFPRIRS